MKGKSQFTQSEADEIIVLIRQKLKADRVEQKQIRAKIRRRGFYGGDDFGLRDGYTEQDFLRVVTIVGEKSINPINTSLRIKTEKVKILKNGISKQMESQNKIAFPPIINEGCKVLILGSLPGDESLKKGEYYANPRNGFRKIMEKLLGGLPESYNSRCKWLLENKISLWDVLENGSRKGSLDSNIESGTPNDFDNFFKCYPNIKYVFFNGTKAQKDYVKYIGLDNKHVFVLLPSSSSARAISFDLKVREWERIVK